MTKNEKKWAENYELLKEYIAEHRQLPDKKKVEHRSLLNWWKYNSKLIRQGKLDEMRTELLMELPTLMMAMTEPIPMMMPSMVRIARILLARRPFRASMIFSPISIALHSPFSLR